MWLCLNEAFLSIVTPAANKPNSDVLLVRARRKGDIERVFPGADVKRTPARDYLFRALISREEIARAMADEVANISYSNFKNSVKDNKLHNAYSRVWGVMSGLQPTRPYSGGRKNNRDLFAEV